ncbi:MAG: hypothetical protein QE271_09260 [Bacteriovoracaceae bacterium]|nr:hypothetical protein [Bacteriovoracaceae bacterium]
MTISIDDTTTNNFKLFVYAYGERNQIIELCRKCLQNLGGEILDFLNVQ